MSKRKILLHLVLFLLTLVCTTLAGVEWTLGNLFLKDGSLNQEALELGLVFSFTFVGILTIHEFGHYFMAKFHKVKVSLPFYIPLWLGFLGIPSLGTAGAWIKMESFIADTKKLYNIGFAGPIAGFIAILIALIYGYTHLPSLDYLFSIHPEYAKYGSTYANEVFNKVNVGTMVVVTQPGLLMQWLETALVSDTSLSPHYMELAHYPILFAAYWGTVFTAMNLLPMGQLDGGHIVFGLFGRKGHYIISRITLVALLLYAGLNSPEIIHQQYEPELSSKLFSNLFYLALLTIILLKPFEDFKTAFMMAISIFAFQYLQQMWAFGLQGYSGWFPFAFIVSRFLGIDYPSMFTAPKLRPWQIVIGVLALIVFIVCFSPQPLQLYTAEEFNSLPKNSH